MSVVFDERDYYNADVKRQFLEYIRKDKRDKFKNAESAFKFITPLEIMREKDLYQLNNLEILEKLKGKAPESARTYVYIYNKYKEWASDRFTDVNSETIERILINEIIVDKGNEKFLSDVFAYTTLLELMNKPHKQNVIPLVLAFDGITGKNDNYDIYNLKINDIDFSTGIVKLKHEDDNVEKLQINTDFIPFINEAIDEKVTEDYDLGKGKIKQIDLVDTGYVCKCSTRIRYGNVKLTRATLNQRLAYLKLKYPELTHFDKLTTLKARNSGMLFYLFMIDKHLKMSITNELVFKLSKRYSVTYSAVSDLKNSYDYYKKMNNANMDLIPLTNGIRKVLDEIVSIELTPKEYAYLQGKVYSNKKSQEEKFEFTDDFDSDWASDLKDRGTKGEKHVIKAIRKIDERIVINKVKDKYGFDLLLEYPKNLIEVKTTVSKRMCIHLTPHEVERGLMSQNYRIILIVTDDFKSIKAVVINNTNELLQFVDNIINENNIKYGNLDISIDSICIQLTTDYIKNQKSFEDFKDEIRRYFED